MTVPPSIDPAPKADARFPSASIPTSPQTCVPNSDRIPSIKPSLLDLPTEIRLEIAKELLNANQIAPSYGYTGPLHLSQKRKLRKHAMILVNKELSMEYRQVFYERTKFFFRVDAQNAFNGAPELASVTTPPSEQGPPIQSYPSTIHGGVLRNFWNAPEGLLRSLRHCTLYIELGVIAGCGRAAHSLSQVTRSDTNLVEARRVRREMMLFRSLSELKAADTEFDNKMKDCILEILRRMEQLRSVQLVWETTVGRRVGLSEMVDWNWETLGVDIVKELKAKRGLEKMLVKVGDCRVDTVYIAEKESGEWKENLIV